MATIDDATRDAIEREVVEALGPVLRRWCVDVTVLVHPPRDDRDCDGRDGAPVLLFKR